MEDRTEELNYLKTVRHYINKILGGFDENLLDLKSYIKEERRRMWDDFVKDSNMPDMFELVQITQTEQRDQMRYERLIKQNEILKLLSGSPYFARIDIKEHGLDREKIYIGRRSLIDKENSDVLVCDWRSDIASVFYESQLGETYYMTPMGKVDCEFLLRRQYKIENGELLYMFDTDVAIEDDILMDELSKSSDEKMKTILTSIQKEQNVIIRNLDSDLLLVQGVAGSGKTSVALHRLAYLLYKYRKTLTSGDIVIFSPNNIFNSYIAGVLPDLGEDRAVQTSFYEYFSLYFPGYEVFDFGIQTEFLLQNENYPESVIFKGSDEFRKLADEYLSDTINYINIQDVYYYGECIRTADEISYLYNDLYKSYKPDVRKNKIKNGILEYLEDSDLKENHRQLYADELTEGGVIAYSDEEMDIAVNKLWETDVARIMQILDSQLTVSAEEAYLSLLERNAPEYYERTKQNLDEKIIMYEDLFCLSYIKFVLGEIPVQSKIKHVVVDEAQSYPPIAYTLTDKIFNQSKHTVLGDIYQSVIPYYGNISEISGLFNSKNKKYIELNKTYRSTVEINSFAENIYKNVSEIKFYQRHGEEISFIRKNELKEFIESNKEKFPSMALICKTSAECEKLRKILYEAGMNLKITERDDVIAKGQTVIIPSYLTKGLEFDCVVVCGSMLSESNDMDKRLLYISATRALHKLALCSE